MENLLRCGVQRLLEEFWETIGKYQFARDIRFPDDARNSKTMSDMTEIYGGKKLILGFKKIFNPKFYYFIYFHDFNKLFHKTLFTFQSAAQSRHFYKSLPTDNPSQNQTLNIRSKQSFSENPPPTNQQVKRHCGFAMNFTEIFKRFCECHF